MIYSNAIWPTVHLQMWVQEFEELCKLGSIINNRRQLFPPLPLSLTQLLKHTFPHEGAADHSRQVYSNSSSLSLPLNVSFTSLSAYHMLFHSHTVPCTHTCTHTYLFFMFQPLLQCITSHTEISWADTAFVL